MNPLSLERNLELLVMIKKYQALPRFESSHAIYMMGSYALLSVSPAAAGIPVIDRPSVYMVFVLGTDGTLRKKSLL